MIELRGVRKHYGEVKAVDGISFTARPGEVFGLIGPNGAGKSTTIKMIMNILAPDGGEILFDGKPLGKRLKDSIGYLPEERGLYKKVKLGEMLAYLASLKNAEPGEAARRIDRWLARFDLAEWKNRRCEDLSKGMSQKAQFIAAVAHDPPYLFLDEPFAGLDPVATDLLRETVLETSKAGKTILFSTHNMEVAERLCSQIFLIDHGREVLSGAMDEVKSRYGRNAVIALRRHGRGEEPVRPQRGDRGVRRRAGHGRDARARGERDPLSPVRRDRAGERRHQPAAPEGARRPGRRAPLRGGFSLAAQDLRAARGAGTPGGHLE
jgi:ABC-2 type transport system ATP-binding protein